MAISVTVSRTFSVHSLSGVISRLGICAYSARRNASSSSPADGPLLSDASSISSIDSSKEEDVQRKMESAIAVSSLLREHGFTEAHISKLESKVPSIFRYKSKKLLSRKLKFLESIGFSSIDVPKIVVDAPYLLSGSLEKRLIPCYNYLKNLPISEMQLKQLLYSFPGTLTVNFETTIAPNVELLRGMDVPPSILTYFLTHHYGAICNNHARFKSAVDQIIKIGSNPSSKMFILAVRALCEVSKDTWARKMAVYREFGLSDDEIMTAFRKQPYIMCISEKKIARGMEFF